MTTPHSFIEARDYILKHRTDYATVKRDFRWPVLTEFNWALDFFDAQAKNNSTLALWIVDDSGSETKITYSELAERSNRAANYLRGLGVKRGDRILMMLGNVVALWETMLAAMKLGAVVIPATTLLNGRDLVDRLERGRVRHVIVGAQDAAKFADVPGDYTRIAVGDAVNGWHKFEDCHTASSNFTPGGKTMATDSMLLYFTSGTTSKPKLVEHSHQSYPVGHLSTLFWLGLKPGDVHLNISSPGWAKHAWSNVFTPFIAGATVFIFNTPRFNAKVLLAAIVRCGITCLCAPPTVWRMLIQEDLASYKIKLTEVIGAGEPLNPEVIERVQKAWNLTIRDGYGQTETTALVGNSPGQKLKPGSMGRPLPGYEIVLLDADDKTVEEGEISLVLSANPLGLMKGYEGDAELTNHAIHHGHYRTGDVASRDADGYLTYVGRADDVFKASDYRISPFELESALIEHPAVAEAGVVPSPDPIKLAVPKAFIALRAGYTPSRELALEIFKFTRENLAPYKRIRRLEFFELPKTISGKIRRVELRKLEASQVNGERREMEFREEDFPDLKG